MEISIKKSEKMDEMGEDENKLIRVTKSFMENIGVNIDDTLNMKSKYGDTLNLVVKPLHNEEDNVLSSTAYVTSEVHKLLEINRKQLDRVENLLIGCDPEFFLVNRPTGKIIPGMVYFSNASDRQVGSDGALMELRPHPNIDSNKVVENIGSLLKRANNKVKDNIFIKRDYRTEDIYMIGSSYYDTQSAGFHIHFGIPPQMLNVSSFDVKIAIGQIANILDYYVGIPSIIPEPLVDANRRMRIEISYGKPGDWRLQFPTFEYRVPGGFLLSDPVLTKGLLSISWLMMDDLLSRIKFATDDFNNIGYINGPIRLKEIYPHAIVDRSKIYNIMCNYNPGKYLDVLENIFKDIEEMESFEKEKKSVVNFYNKITSDTKYVHNIEENWGLRT